MDHHDLPAGFVAPLVNTHSPVRSLDISGAGEEVWRVRKGGDLGLGEVGDLGGEGRWGGITGFWVGHGLLREGK